jgi:predicted anti-sigma-YlaC factor YlaD
MNCQECELALAGEERSLLADGRVEAHMAECSACREFAVELRENSEALRAFSMESMPALPKVPFHATPRRQPAGQGPAPQ